MNYKSLISSLIESTIKEKHNFKAPTAILKLIEKPKNEDMGDLAFPCFIYAKPLKLSPKDVASFLESELSSKKEELFCSSIKAEGPFFKLYLKHSCSC